MSITAILSGVSRFFKILPHLKSLVQIGLKIYEAIKGDDEMENPSTVEVLEAVKRGESSVKDTFAEIQKAFAKVKSD